MTAEKLPAIARSERPKRISAKIQAAIDAMVHGDVGTITAAAEKAGCSREHLSRELSKPHVAKVLQERTMRNLAISAAKAGATKVKLLDSPNELVRDRASSFILGVSGISPENAPAAPGSQRALPGLQIVVMMDSGQQRVVAGPNGSMEPRLNEYEPAHLENHAFIGAELADDEL